ncbi:MAG: MBL fold metallo-hydrolase [Ketobacteraceae bacterium]|nr:MBL fold metallo-hydrolase [Ketobacteraceae bacterium]
MRSPLPFSLDHINCYLIHDGEGWAVVDTGMKGRKAIEQWKAVIADALDGLPITRVISTHHHPDHIGLAGWFCDSFKVPFYTSEAEYFYTRAFHGPKRKEGYWETINYFNLTNMRQSSRDALLGDNNYHQMVWDVPSAFHRLQDGDHFAIGDTIWEVITTRGHAPEHVSLYCESLGLLISGDQVLPEITSNVSITSTQAYADPLQDWFDAHNKIREQVPDGAMVLPAHQLPFRGLHERLDEVVAHHHERLDRIITLCTAPKDPQTLTDELFNKEMDAFQNFLAVGECMAHVNWLLARGKLTRDTVDGQWRLSA